MPTDLKHTIYPGKIYDQLLSPESCYRYRKLIDGLAYEDGHPNTRYFQDIMKMPKIANELWEIIKDDLPKTITRRDQEYRLVGLSDHLTISRHRGKNIGIHQDKDVRVSQNGQRKSDCYCFYKLAIYLNDLSDPHDYQDRTGGTCFYDNRENLLYTAKPQEGRGVLFDMREWHSGAQVPRGATKYMLGARPIYQKIRHSENMRERGDMRERERGERRGRGERKDRRGRGERKDRRGREREEREEREERGRTCQCRCHHYY